MCPQATESLISCSDCSSLLSISLSPAQQPKTQKAGAEQEHDLGVGEGLSYTMDCHIVR